MIQVEGEALFTGGVCAYLLPVIPGLRSQTGYLSHLSEFCDSDKLFLFFCSNVKFLLVFKAAKCNEKKGAEEII